MTAPDPASRPAQPASDPCGLPDTPVTRAEFERLIAIVRELASITRHHKHNVSGADVNAGWSASTDLRDMIEDLEQQLDRLGDGDDDAGD